MTPFTTPHPNMSLPNCPSAACLADDALRRTDAPAINTYTSHLSAHAHHPHHLTRYAGTKVGYRQRQNNPCTQHQQHDVCLNEAGYDNTRLDNSPAKRPGLHSIAGAQPNIFV